MEEGEGDVERLSEGVVGLERGVWSVVWLCVMRWYDVCGDAWCVV